jgi:hypothetical protein
MIMQYMTNFFSSAYPVAGIAIATLLGGLVLGTIIKIVTGRRN